MNSIAIFFICRNIIFRERFLASILCQTSKFLEKQEEYEYCWWTIWKR